MNALYGLSDEITRGVIEKVLARLPERTAQRRRRVLLHFPGVLRLTSGIRLRASQPNRS